MTDELVSFTMLVVSDVSAERDLLRRAALNSSFHVEVTEIEKCVDDQPIRALFLRESVDFIFLDSRMPKAGRQAVINAAADAKDNPLVVLVWPADIKTREVLGWQGVHVLHFAGSSCSQKLRIFLNLKGIKWQSHPIPSQKFRQSPCAGLPESLVCLRRNIWPRRQT